ncbi:MAG: transglutaminase family protein, partial [Acidobacteriota bacterium]|nr:transglutaminase family protein [Acidobacteriota bacterium]
MIYRIIHRTTYKYKYPVSVGNHVACLTPRSLPHHRRHWHDLRVTPLPATRNERIDYFGNHLSFFTVQEPHWKLVVEARSEMTLDGETNLEPEETLPWERVPNFLREDLSPASLDAYQFTFESPRIRRNAELASYALESF